MKKINLLLTSIFLWLSLFISTSFAIPTGSSTLWEKAALGKVPGITLVNILGNIGTLTTTARTIWPENTAYTFLAANMSNPTISSSSASDTAAGTGARTVSVTCVDASYVETTVTYTLNGQTGVALTKDCMTINAIQVATVGSGGVNAGTIYVGTGTVTTGKPAVVHGEIAIGLNVSQSAIYITPANYSLLCRSKRLSSYGVTAAQTVLFQSDAITNLGPKLEVFLGAVNQAGSSVLENETQIDYFPEKTQVMWSALSAASTGPAYLTIQCLKVNNTWLTSAQDIL